MSLLATQTLTQTGLTPMMSNASQEGDQFQPSSTTFLLIRNSDTAAHTVTVAVTATAYGQPVENVPVVVPAGGQVLAGPYDPGEVAAPQTGLASVSYDSYPPLSVAILTI